MKFTGERYIPGCGLGKELEIEHLQRYYSVINLVKGKVVIDAASGEGYGTNILAQHADFVYGIDISKEVIEHAKKTYTKENLEFITASISRLPIQDKSIDVFVSFETIEHVDADTQVQFLKEIKRVLKEDGILIISTPDKYIYSDVPKYKNEFHIKEFYKEEFYDFLKKYFSNVDFFYQSIQIASVIKNKYSSKFENLSISDNYPNMGKYIVAVCSNSAIKNKIDIDSVVFSNQLSYTRLMERIIQLQAEVEERNDHIKKLDGEIHEYQKCINKLQKDIESKDQQVLNQLNQINELLNGTNNLHQLLNKKDNLISDQKISLGELQAKVERIEKDLFEKELLLKDAEKTIIALETKIEEAALWSNIINELQQKDKTILEVKEVLQVMNEEVKKRDKLLEKEKAVITNHLGHIEQLLEKERILNNILASDGWRILTKYYRIRDFIIPPNSKRRLFFRLIFRMIKNPKQFLQSMNVQNIKKFIHYLKTENSELLDSRIENYIERQSGDYERTEIQAVEKIKNKTKIIFDRFDNPLVSIIIPVYNQWDYTYSCLKSIYENTIGIPYEIIIADDVSNDETVNINEYVDNITVIRNDKNLGFLLNCNNAAKKARGKYIHFLNNDTNVQKDWLKYLVDLIENDKTIGIVGSKLVYKDGKLQEAGGIIWKDASGWNYGRLDDPEKPEYNYVKEVDYISGASILIRKDLWCEIGGFDDRYVPAYFEDADLAFEVRKRGYKVVYQPKSVVVHFEGVSHGKDTKSGVKSYQIKNKEKFIVKWKDVLEKDHFENGENVFWARDRSKDKKTILVIDHYVPHYDKDAGSRCTYSYLKLFAEMGFKVIFLGDNFYRHEPYTSELQEKGIEVLYGNWYSRNIKEWIKKNNKFIDYVYLNRPHISIKYVDFLKINTNAKIIYFGHDLHYLREIRNYEIEKNRELLKSSAKWKEIEFELFNKADVIYVVSCYEEQLLKKEFPNKTIRTIPVYIFDNKQDVVNPYENREDILFVGGFNHKPNIDAVLWFVKDIFPRILNKYPAVKFYVVGSNPPETIRQLQTNNIIVTGFVTDEELQNLYNHCKLVVVPLRFGAGVKGKVVEAMYYQVPIVTTSIGAEGLSNIEDFIIIEDKPEDFAEKVIKIYHNKEEWTRLSQGSYNYVLNTFSTKAALEIVSKDFR
jgi:GT2 family glycosyltransferase/ubiquinone/menaquinone biosynthesis C-methylase UbiE